MKINHALPPSTASSLTFPSTEFEGQSTAGSDGPEPGTQTPRLISALAGAGMEGPIWSAICELQAAIATRDISNIPVLVPKAFPNRSAIKEFQRAHGQARWPGSYGDSPVQHVADLATAFVHSRHLDQRGFIRTVAQARSTAYLALVDVHGGPLLRRRFEIGFDHALRLWPRLFWACRQAGILTPGETAAALVLWMRAPHLDRTSKAAGSGSGHEQAGSEAVAHLGGTGNLLRAARRWRRLFVTSPAARAGQGFCSMDPAMSGPKQDWWLDPVGGTYYPSRSSVASNLPAGRFVLPSAAPIQD